MVSAALMSSYKPFRPQLLPLQSSGLTAFSLHKPAWQNMMETESSGRVHHYRSRCVTAPQSLVGVRDQPGPDRLNPLIEPD